MRFSRRADGPGEEGGEASALWGEGAHLRALEGRAKTRPLGSGSCSEMYQLPTLGQEFNLSVPFTQGLPTGLLPAQRRAHGSHGGHWNM